MSDGLIFLSGLLCGGAGMLCIIGFIGGTHINVEIKPAEIGKHSAHSKEES